MTTERHEFWVCTDCYFAHHYGAHSETREATEAEVAHWLHSEHNTYHAREVMGLEFDETPEGVQVTEWFAGESDQRCEGGEPLRLIPDGAAVSDNTCSNHFYGQGVTPDDWDDDCNTCGGTRRWETTTEDSPTVLVDLGECPDCIPEPVCDHCGAPGWEDGMTDFTWSSCDGCGCTLGGSRYRLAVDIDHQEVTA